MSNEKKSTIVWSMFVIGLALCVLGGRLGGNGLVQKAGAVLVIIAGVLEFTQFRCPHCKRNLGRKLFSKETCPYCGGKLK